MLLEFKQISDECKHGWVRAWAQSLFLPRIFTLNCGISSKKIEDWQSRAKMNSMEISAHKMCLRKNYKCFLSFYCILSFLS